MSPPCSNKGCYCDQTCYTWNDCCSDIADIGCYHPAYSSSHIVSSTPSSPIVLPTPTETLSKTKSEAHAIQYNHSFLNKLTLINNQYKIW